jgi:hypothetical protein
MTCKAKITLNPCRTLRACDNAKHLFAVHVKVKYGWIGDTDTTLMVLADTHDQARRRAAAEYVMVEGVSLPLDDAHFCETMVGGISYEEPLQLQGEPPVVAGEVQQMLRGIATARDSQHVEPRLTPSQQYTPLCDMPWRVLSPDVRCGCVGCASWRQEP